MNKDHLKIIKSKMQGEDSVNFALYERSTNMEASSASWDDLRLADGVPILARKKVSTSDANLRLNHDLFNLVAKEKAGYFASNIKRTYADDVQEDVRNKYLEFDRRNSIRKKYKNMGISCSSWGVTYSLCRLSEQGMVLFDEVDAWNAKVFYGGDGQPVVGYIYGVDKDSVMHVKEYTNIETITYKGSKDSERLEQVDRKFHGFRAVPLIEWRNDETKQGNSERAVSLIDAYDLMVSDNSTEQAAFRNAYLLLTNLGTIDEDTKEQMRKTGILTADGENPKAEFVTKDINPEFSKLVMQTVWENIFVVSSTVDTKALTALSNATAFQISQIYRNLENDAQNTELEWRESLEQLDRVLKSFWTGLASPSTGDYNTYDIEYEFKRNKPKDTLSDLEAIRRAGGIVPNYEILRRTLDVSETVARELAEEAEQEMSVSLPSFEE